MVTIGRAIWRAVLAVKAANLFGETRNTAADANVANKQDVPAAASQLNTYMAAYGEGFAVTGGIRVTTLCRPGHGNVIVARLTNAFTGSASSPHNSTKVTRNA
jgi:hypothetical protein